jgi:hypothetical protein
MSPFAVPPKPQTRVLPSLWVRRRALHPLEIPEGLVLSPKLLDFGLGANPRYINDVAPTGAPSWGMTQ